GPARSPGSRIPSGRSGRRTSAPPRSPVSRAATPRPFSASSDKARAEPTSLVVSHLINRVARLVRPTGCDALLRPAKLASYASNLGRYPQAVLIAVHTTNERHSSVHSPERQVRGGAEGTRVIATLET